MTYRAAFAAKKHKLQHSKNQDEINEQATYGNESNERVTYEDDIMEQINYKLKSETNSNNYGCITMLQKH